MVRLGRVARGPRLPWPWNGATWFAVGLLVIVVVHSVGGLLIGSLLIVWGVFVLGGWRVAIMPRHRRRAKVHH